MVIFLKFLSKIVPSQQAFMTRKLMQINIKSDLFPRSRKSKMSNTGLTVNFLIHNFPRFFKLFLNFLDLSKLFLFFPAPKKKIIVLIFFTTMANLEVFL